MRLEDWQKFIESQFLEDIVESLANDAVAPVVHDSAMDTNDPAIASEPEPHTTMVPPPIAPANSTPETSPCTTGAPDPAFSPFGVVPNFDTNLPNIEEFLSWNRDVNAASVPVETPISAQPDPSPALAPLTELSASRKTTRSNPSRARQTRPSLPSGDHTVMSKAQLWANVPKYVETLLALQKIEENLEVAQYSYKRPFSEKRQELIERILDPILTLEETARLLNVCPTTVRRYTNRGLLNYYRKEIERPDRESNSDEKETRQRRFRLSDILMFLETQQLAVESDRNADNVRNGSLKANTALEVQPEPPRIDAETLTNNDPAETP